MNNNVMNNNSTGLSLFSMKTSRIFLSSHIISFLIVLCLGSCGAWRTSSEKSCIYHTQWEKLPKSLSKVERFKIIYWKLRNTGFRDR
jgi:hypothetical protein